MKVQVQPVPVPSVAILEAEKWQPVPSLQISDPSIIELKVQVYFGFLSYGEMRNSVIHALRNMQLQVRPGPSVGFLSLQFILARKYFSIYFSYTTSEWKEKAIA